MAEREVSEAEFDHVIGAVFGRAPAVDDEAVSLFRQAGLDEASALTAAKGLREGWYFSFEDAALSQASGFDSANRRRNPEATPSRIAEVAKRLPDYLKVEG